MEIANKRLLKASIRADLDEILLALKSGANPNCCNEHGETPLMLICGNAYIRGIENVFDEEEDESEEEKAAESLIVKILDKLLTCGVNIYATNSLDQNALFYAASRLESES